MELLEGKCLRVREERRGSEYREEKEEPFGRNKGVGGKKGLLRTKEKETSSSGQCNINRILPLLHIRILSNTVMHNRFWYQYCIACDYCNISIHKIVRYARWMSYRLYTKYTISKRVKCRVISIDAREIVWLIGHNDDRARIGNERAFVEFPIVQEVLNISSIGGTLHSLFSIHIVSLRAEEESLALFSNGDRASPPLRKCVTHWKMDGVWWTMKVFLRLYDGEIIDGSPFFTFSIILFLYSIKLRECVETV